MRLPKNTLAVSLMISSMLLLLFFELFWLRREYREQREWLTSTTDYLFQKSVFETQDQILVRWLKRASTDEGIPQEVAADNIGEILLEKNPPKLHIDISENHDESTKDSLEIEHISFFTATSKDTGNVSRKISLRISDFDGEKNFTMLDLTGDTISMNRLEKEYRQRLDTAGIYLPFQLKKVSETELADMKTNWKERPFKTAPIFAGVNSGRYYLAIFPDAQWLLIRKIVPQMLFSVFLFLLTALAFWIIFRNLQQQRRLIALKNDFIGNITHELKTPITTVGVAIEALSNFNALQDPKKTEDYLEISRNELKRLSLLVDKVLRMSLFEQQEPELKLENFDLRELVEEILRTMRLQFDKFAAKVHFEPQGQNFQLEADRLHITSVIYNLIDNALKYSQDHPKIDIELHQEGNQLALSVRDNGRGIPPEYQSRIFDKFFRVPAGDRHDTKGHGLGLSYIASVVRKHRGRINLNSKVGEGSEFVVFLPAKADVV